MSILALSLILASAVIHATWNLFAKRLSGGGETVWLFTAAAAALYAPVAAVTIAVTGYQPGGADLVFLLGTGVLQTLYFVVLRRGYATDDLSIVYPLARGTGPLVAVVLATALVGERPSPLTAAGAGVVALGTLLLVTPVSRQSDHRKGALLGMATGVIIGCYTVWDGYAVGSLAIPALLLAWAGDAGRMVLLTPLALRRRMLLSTQICNHRRELLAVAVLSTLSYVMVLAAMEIAPISSVAPARELGIVIGALFGMLLLGEPGGWRRVSSAAVITAGVGLVALG
ncbi:MAG TPA: DMT family transporter [Thermomicrobiales bacterium]|nr:DMT family transporter [Thermomicrobiales bacterium]